jgi:hypothetical protein
VWREPATLPAAKDGAARRELERRRSCAHACKRTKGRRRRTRGGQAIGSVCLQPAQTAPPGALGRLQAGSVLQRGVGGGRTLVRRSSVAGRGPPGWATGEVASRRRAGARFRTSHGCPGKRPSFPPSTQAAAAQQACPVAGGIARPYTRLSASASHPPRHSGE